MRDAFMDLLISLAAENDTVVESQGSVVNAKGLLYKTVNGRRQPLQAVSYDVFDRYQVASQPFFKLKRSVIEVFGQITVNNRMSHHHKNAINRNLKQIVRDHIGDERFTSINVEINTIMKRYSVTVWTTKKMMTTRDKLFLTERVKAAIEEWRNKTKHRYGNPT